MEKVTVYVRSEFGMGVKRIEATRLSVEVGPYAQYLSGIKVSLLPKRMRRMRGFTQAYGPSLVVLEGWGHPEPDGMWDPAKERSEGDVTTSEARYSACDPRWQSDFDAKIDAHIARGAKVLYDFRKHNPHRRETECTCFSCSKRNQEIAELLATFTPPAELPEVFA
jgi:hypothetical protein